MSTACVFSLDNSYELPFKVLFHTLQETSSIPLETEIFILHTTALKEAAIARIRAFSENYKRGICFLNIEKMIPENLPIRPGDHVSAATFYRLFIAEILPSHITTAIYLDCDMIALKSIASLFSTDIGNFLVGAVDHCSPRDQLRLWGEKSGTYFQAGVLVIPTESWRKQYLYRSFLKTINEDNGNICWWDQDVLNITLNNNWHRLPIWMNVCRELQNTIPREIVGEKTCLIHYSGRDKPWNKTYYLPYDEHWLRAYERLFGTKYSKPILPLSCQLSALISWARSTLKSICSASATLRSTFKWTSLK